jgi:hypothetical protein
MNFFTKKCIYMAIFTIKEPDLDPGQDADQDPDPTLASTDIRFALKNTLKRGAYFPYTVNKLQKPHKICEECKDS